MAGFGRGGGPGSNAVQDTAVDPVIYDATTITGDAVSAGVIQMKKGKTYRVDSALGQVTLVVWAVPVVGDSSRWIDVSDSVNNFNPILVDVGSDFWFGKPQAAPVRLIQRQGSGAIKYMGALPGFCASY